MEAMDQWEKLPSLPSAHPGKMKSAWNAGKSFLGLIWRSLGAAFRAIGFALAWSWLEFRYWFHIFLYMSRGFLRIEMYLSLVGAFLFFGWVLTHNLANHMVNLLYFCYLYFSVVMVMLCMNLLPRERDEDTLEILWSQPMRRGVMIFVQLTTVSIWVLLLSVFTILFFSYFGTYPGGQGLSIFFLSITLFTVGAITVMISTLCRHAIATGLVTLLILGVHFFWLRPIGPIELFYIPMHPPGFDGPPLSFWSLFFNRFIVVVLAGFVLDYLFRRLRQTARWFT